MGAYLVWVDANGVQNTLKFDLVESEDWSEPTTITEHPVEQGSDVADNVRVSLLRCKLSIFATNDPIGANNWTQANLQTTQLSLPGPNQVRASSATVAKTWDNRLALRSALTGAGAGLGGAVGGVAGGIVGAVAGAVVGNALAPGQEVDVPWDPGAGLNPTPGQNPTIQNYQLAQSDDYVSRMIAQLAYLKGDPVLGSTPQLLTVIGTKRAGDNFVIETFDHHRGAPSETGTGASIELGLKQIRFVATQQVTAPVPSLPRAATSKTKGPQNPPDDPQANQKRSFLKQLLYGTMGGAPANTNLGSVNVGPVTFGGG